jgi:hypothetical protein
MLPAKPLSEMTEEEILAELRAIRVKRVVAKERASKPRGSRKLVNDMNLANIFDQINSMPGEPSA